jgi:hypothetical protein
MTTTPLPDDFKWRLDRLEQRARCLHNAIGACVPYSGAQPVSPFIDGFVDRIYEEASALLPGDFLKDLSPLMTTKGGMRTLLDASAVLAVVRDAIDSIAPSEGFGFNQ